MVSKVIVSAPMRPSRIRPRPRRDGNESLSTLGMNDVSMPTKQALRDMRSPPPKTNNPPQFVITPRTSNQTSQCCGAYGQQSALVDRTIYSSRPNKPPTTLSRRNQTVSTKTQTAVLQSQEQRRHPPTPDHHQRHSDQNTRRRTKEKKHKKSTKEIMRDPEMQAALDAALERLKRRRQCDGSAAPSSYMQSAIDHIIHIDEMQHLPNLHLPDLYHNEVEDKSRPCYKPRHNYHHRKQPRPEDFPLDREFTDMRELRDVVEVFSEYEFILNRLVEKHARLMAYVEGADNLPEEFQSTSLQVKKRLAKLKTERRAKMGPHTKNNHEDSQKRQPKQVTQQKVQFTTTRRSPVRQNVIPQENERSTLLPKQTLRMSVNNHETSRAIETRQRSPVKNTAMRYGRNEGFIHGTSPDNKIAASNPGHLYLSHGSGEQEESQPSTKKGELRSTTPLRTRSAEGHPTYQESARIQKLREELKNLRKQRKESPYRPKRKTESAKVDPSQSRYIPDFSRPTSPSNLDPGGGRYDPFTKAEAIQPADTRVAQRLDAPGTRMHEASRKERELPLIRSPPRIKRYLTPPDCEPTTTRNEALSDNGLDESRRGYSSDSFDEDVEEPSTKTDIHENDVKAGQFKRRSRKQIKKETLPAQRKRIEEIERMVVASKSNELDRELEKEILKMGPLFTTESLSFSEELSSSTDGSDYSRSDYETDSIAESRYQNQESRASCARPYRYTMGKAPSNVSNDSSRFSKKVRRAELLRRLIQNRDAISRKASIERANRLSELMPDSTRNPTLDVPPVSNVSNVDYAVLPKVSSLSSTNDEQGHFLPVSPSNRGRWQSYSRLAPEESIDLLPTFSDNEMHFHASSFFQQLRVDHDGTYEKEDDCSADIGQEIQIVESNDGVIHIRMEDDHAMNGPEGCFGKPSKNRERTETNQVHASEPSESSESSIDRLPREDHNRLHWRQEHYLQLSPSFKEHQYGAEQKNEILPDQASVSVSEPTECRYTPAPMENEATSSKQEEPSNEIISPLKANKPKRATLRQSCKSLLSCNSSEGTQSSESGSRSTALNLVHDHPKYKNDRYMPQTGLGNDTQETKMKKDHDSSAETSSKNKEMPDPTSSVIQPPPHHTLEGEKSNLLRNQPPLQLESKHDPPTVFKVFEHNKPQDHSPPTVFASPKGNAIAQPIERSWLGPFNFWG